MPVYVFKCMHCGYLSEGTYPITTGKILDCPECGIEDVFVKQITAPNIIIKGASAKNGYYTPPTNEQLGLPSERKLRKQLESEYWAQNLQKGSMVNAAEKEIIDHVKGEQKDIKKKRDKRLKYLTEKYPREAKAAKNAMKQAKNLTPEQRKARFEKRKAAGDAGTYRKIISNETKS